MLFLLLFILLASAFCVSQKLTLVILFRLQTFFRSFLVDGHDPPGVFQFHHLKAVLVHPGIYFPVYVPLLESHLAFLESFILLTSGTFQSRFRLSLQSLVVVCFDSHPLLVCEVRPFQLLAVELHFNLLHAAGIGIIVDFASGVCDTVQGFFPLLPFLFLLELIAVLLVIIIAVSSTSTSTIATITTTIAFIDLQPCSLVSQCLVLCRKVVNDAVQLLDFLIRFIQLQTENPISRR